MPEPAARPLRGRESGGKAETCRWIIRSAKENEDDREHDEKRNNRADNIFSWYPTLSRAKHSYLKVQYVPFHVEYVYDHRHLLLEGAAREIVLKQQGLDLLHRATRTALTCGSRKACTCCDACYCRAYGALRARGWRRLLDAARCPHLPRNGSARELSLADTEWQRQKIVPFQAPSNNWICRWNSSIATAATLR